MSTRRHVIMYSAEFSALVARGVKTCTIRSWRRPPRPGDVLTHRRWLGTAYRPGSMQHTIRTSLCHAVGPIVVDASRCVRRGSENLTVAQIDALARADGFASRTEMIDYIAERYGLPFQGVLIEWEA